MTSPVSTPPLRDVTSVNAAPYVTPPVCTWPHIRDTCVCGINIAWLFGEQERHKYRMSPQCGVLQAGVCRVSHVLHGSGSVVCVKYCVLNTSTDAACSGRVRQILHPPHVKYSVQSVLQALCVCVCVCVCVCARVKFCVWSPQQASNVRGRPCTRQQMLGVLGRVFAARTTCRISVRICFKMKLEGPGVSFCA